METCVVFLLSNSSKFDMVNEFRSYLRKYFGLSRYSERNDDSDAYRNAVTIKGFLSDEEKKHLINFSKELFVFFLEGDDSLNDTNTIVLKKDEVLKSTES